jgi:hypothetical protein
MFCSFSSVAWDGMFQSFLLPLCIIIIHCILWGISHVKLRYLRCLWHRHLSIVMVLWRHTRRLVMVTWSQGLWILIHWRHLVCAHLSLELINVLQSTIVCVSTELSCLITWAALRITKMHSIRLLWKLLITLMKLLLISRTLRWIWCCIKLLLWIVVRLNISCLFCWWVTIVSTWHLLVSIVRSTRPIRIRICSKLIWWKLSFQVDFTCWGSPFAQWEQVPYCGLQVAKLIYWYLRLSNYFTSFDAFRHNF